MKTKSNPKVVPLSTGPTTTTILHILIITMVMINTACLQTVMQSAPSATSTARPTESAFGAEPESGTVHELPAKSYPLNATCASVTAKTLHLREKASEKSKALAWLPAETIVVVIGRVGKWWKVQTPLGDGYAKADYLKESECK